MAIQRRNTRLGKESIARWMQSVFLKRNCKDKTSCHILKLCQETDKCFEEIKVYVKSLEIF